MKNKIVILVFLTLIPFRLLLAQANCNTANGVLALMVAKVVVGTPRTPATEPPSATLPFIITSELFKVPQNESSNSTCFQSVTFQIYTASSSSALSSLPNLATSNPSFTLPSGVSRSTMTKTRVGNVITATVNLSRTGVTAGSTRFFRIAKRITNCSSCSGVDPTVFSSTFSFVVPAAPAPPVVAKLPDLLPRPTANSNVNRPLFRPAGGSFGANNITYLQIPNEFCQGLPAGTQVSTFPCGTNTCRELRHSVPLGPVIYAARNSGDTASGAFTVTLHRKDKVGSNSSSTLTQVASSNVAGLAVNAQSANFSFNPNRTVEIHTFPEANPGLCFVRCDPNQGGCVVPYQEEEYKVKVDGGNNVLNNGAVREKSESNNEGNPMD